MTKTYQERCADLIERVMALVEQADDALMAASPHRLAATTSQLASEARDLDFNAQQWAEKSQEDF